MDDGVNAPVALFTQRLQPTADGDDAILPRPCHDVD